MSPRTRERIIPYVVPLVLAGGYWFINPSFPKGEGILSASITMGAIFTGFLATSKSIALTSSSAAMRKLRKTQFFGLLMSYLREAILVSLFYCATMLVGFFLDTPETPRWFATLWVYLTACTFLTFWRITKLLIELNSDHG